MDVIAALGPAPVVAEVSLGVVVEDDIVLLPSGLIEVIATFELLPLTPCDVPIIPVVGLIVVVVLLELADDIAVLPPRVAGAVPVVGTPVVSGTADTTVVRTLVTVDCMGIEVELVEAAVVTAVRCVLGMVLVC